MQKQSPRGFSAKKGVLKNFMKFTGKHLCQSLSLDKVACLMPVNYLKRDFPSAQVFFYKFGKVFKMNLNEYAVNNE